MGAHTAAAWGQKEGHRQPQKMNKIERRLDETLLTASASPQRGLAFTCGRSDAPSLCCRRMDVCWGTCQLLNDHLPSCTGAGCTLQVREAAAHTLYPVCQHTPETCCRPLLLQHPPRHIYQGGNSRWTSVSAQPTRVIPQQGQQLTACIPCSSARGCCGQTAAAPAAGRQTSMVLLLRPPRAQTGSPVHTRPAGTSNGI